MYFGVDFLTSTASPFGHFLVSSGSSCWRVFSRWIRRWIRETFVRMVFIFWIIRLDSLAAIEAHIPVWRADLENPDKLKNIYIFSFNFYKESPDKKNIGCFSLEPIADSSDIETSCAVIDLLLSKRPHISNLLNFLRKVGLPFKITHFAAKNL